MRRIATLLIGLALPGCSGHGAQGVPMQPPIDMAHLIRPSKPNTALAAPAGFSPTPDILTRRYEVTPQALYAAVRRTAARQPRTFEQIAYDDRLQVHFVARSALMNFPDLIAAQVNSDGTLVLWSRSVYGRSDLGVNRRRLVAWLGALDTTLATH